MNYIAATIICLFVVELANILPLIKSIKCIFNLMENSKKVLLSSYISDHRKGFILPIYSLRMLKSSLSAGLWAMVVFSPLLLAVVLSRYLDSDFEEFLFSLKGGLFLTVVALFYLTCRRFVVMLLPDSGSYGFLSQLLHQLALGSKNIAKISFSFDQSVGFEAGQDVKHDRHVFIAGLARAGTTILMRRFYESGGFCSLTYRDMPFVLAPNLWRRLRALTPPITTSKKERAHGDGLQVDFDSPEALEEVFWRVFCGTDYIQKSSLVPVKISSEVTRYFVGYVNAIIQSKGSHAPHRYLSKNNNNILRLHTIAKTFPNAILIIPFRSPLQHAYSLLRQHERFTKRNAGNRFEMKYMNWLAHHEFGGNHKPFLFDEDEQANKDEFSLEYWLEIWLRTYRYLLRSAPRQAIFIGYDRLCEGEALWQCLEKHAEINVSSECQTSLYFSSKPVEFDTSGSLYKEVNAVHLELLERCNEFVKSTAN